MRAYARNTAIKRYADRIEQAATVKEARLTMAAAELCVALRNDDISKLRGILAERTAKG